MQFSCDDYSRKYDINLDINFWKKILACLPFASQKKHTNSVHFKVRMLDN